MAKKKTKKSTRRAGMSKSRASKVLRSGRGGSKSAAALALSGRQSKSARRASGKTAMYERNLDKPWSSADDRQMRQLVADNTPTRVIGLKLGRSEASIYDRAAQIGLSLKPSNQSPYNRRGSARRS